MTIRAIQRAKDYFLSFSFQFAIAPTSEDVEAEAKQMGSAIWGVFFLATSSSNTFLCASIVTGSKGARRDRVVPSIERSESSIWIDWKPIRLPSIYLSPSMNGNYLRNELYVCNSRLVFLKSGDDQSSIDLDPTSTARARSDVDWAGGYG